MLVADAVPLAVRIEIAAPALVVLADSMAAVGIEVALAPLDPASPDSHHREHGDAGKDDNGDQQYLFHFNPPLWESRHYTEAFFILQGNPPASLVVCPRKENP
jgi:hypothetical protein